MSDEELLAFISAVRAKRTSNQIAAEMKPARRSRGTVVEVNESKRAQALAGLLAGED